MRRVLPVLLLALLAPAHAPAQAAAEDRTPNITGLYRLPYTGGTELTSDGRYVFAGQWNGRTNRYEYPRQGGVRIFDSKVWPPKLVGTIKCAGTDMDVAVVRPGLLAIGHHYSACGVRGNGITLFDVKNPAKPKRLSTLAVPSAHTLTAVPGANVLYVSPGGTGSANGLTTVVDVSDAKRPKVRAYIRPDFWGCHDVTFATSVAGKPIGVCTGLEGITIWDMANPISPKVLSTVAAEDEVTGDYIQFAHGSAVSPDGGLLVVNDEAYSGHRCDGKDEEQAGSLHLYDISAPGQPVFLGRIVPPRGRTKASGRWVETWCTSHQLNFMPGSRRLVNAWFTGGVSVWDLTVPVAPREEAHYVGNGAITWSAHWFGDRIWVNDMARGFEVLEMSPIPDLPVPVSPAWRPATSRPKIPFDRPAPPQGFVCPA
ncbi:MAG TPA: hypothetical protein VNQ77_15990 [Frankiaceae bacterium]|nr:hypothetical protein [Frankiaceae bacterium]